MGVKVKGAENFCTFQVVASSGIEPESGASETLILSIVLRGHVLFRRFLFRL